LRIEFLAFLPYYTSADEIAKGKETMISHEVVSNEQCVEFRDPVGSSAVLSEVCMNNLRPILLSSTDYSMGKVNPEPLGAEGGNT
jgi:hypothetical protein